MISTTGDKSLHLAIIVMALAVLGSAFFVSYSSHLTRKSFVELSELQQQRDDMQVEWRQLLLEHSTWAAYGRVEQVARGELQMQVLAPERIVMVPLDER